MTGNPSGSATAKELPGLDPLGWFIANLHQLLGHDKAAAVLGVDVGPKEYCLICIYEDEPTPENKAAVLSALAPKVT